MVGLAGVERSEPHPTAAADILAQLQERLGREEQATRTAKSEVFGTAENPVILSAAKDLAGIPRLTQ
jgi:hypothetical protein